MISIIVPVFNEQAMFHQQKTMFQTLQEDAEVIFCDGGSKDGTWESLKNASFDCVQSDAGRALQMNTGAKQAHGDILLFVHIDTILDANCLQAVKEAMDDIDVVGGRFDVCLSGTHPMFRIIERMINFRSRWTKVSTGDQCQFVRKDVFENINGFPEIALMEDVALSKKLRTLGKLACLRQKVETSSRRWEKHGIAKTIGLMWSIRFLYWLGVSAKKLSKMYR
ncbi:MAG: TIGR04283 family arsenosugar biosynthesis glycosyltransferase [Mariprofundaceae bacterium]|nr:TIGR04283 family arsenosugar biosynthesis glycosyltransferase [Mariprofundaceae bacterium]